MEPTLSIRECLRYGWETFKKRPWFFAGVTLLLGLITFVLPNPNYDGPWTLIVPVFALSLLLNLFLDLAAKSVALRAHDSPETVTMRDLWRPRLYPSYLGVGIVGGIIVLLGLILLIVPGIIAAIALSLAGYLVVDKGMRPIAALKESRRLTKGYRWRLLLLYIVLCLVNILGALLLLVGLLVTVPVTIIAIAHAYRHIEKAGRTAPVEA